MAIRRLLRICTIPAASILLLLLAGCSNLAGGEDGPSIPSHYVKISSTHGGFGGSLDDNDEFGISVADIGDLDGDGVRDLAVGADMDGDGGPGRGAVWILFLKTDLRVKGWAKISDTAGGFTGPLDDNDEFGKSVTGLGDLDKDGNPDIAVGADMDDDGGVDTGAVWVLFLNRDGTVKAHQKISAGEGGFGAGLAAGDAFGKSLADLGDTDGNGTRELAVGAPLADDGGTEKGAVWVLSLNGSGMVAGKKRISEGSGGFGGKLRSNDWFGMYVAVIGDVDQDGVQDLGVGAMHDDDGGLNSGAVWVLFMNEDGSVAGQQKISPDPDLGGGFSGPLDPWDYFGKSVAGLGDLDGDGFQDIAVGAIQDDDGGADVGAVWVLFLRGNGTVKSQQKISLRAGNLAPVLDPYDSFGKALSPLAGRPFDLAVSAYDDDDGGHNRGAVWILPLTRGGTVE